MDTGIELSGETSCGGRSALRGWSAAERESFLNAITRHQRAAWRVTLASRLANLFATTVAALLMGPLFYSVLLLALDIVNLVGPAPNFATGIFRVVDPILEATTAPSFADWLRFISFAVLPGALWMGVVMIALNRMLRASGMFDLGELPARAVNPTVLAEQRLGNVVAEMAIAANLPPPRVLIAPRAPLNALVLGRDARRATLVVSQSLLNRLNRDEMQGVAAHLVASIANGDMRIGMRATLTSSLFGVLTRISTIVIARQGARRAIFELLLAISFPTPARTRLLMAALADPFSLPASAPTPVCAPAKRKPLDVLQTILWLMLLGPVALAGFFGGVVGGLALGPLLACAWRERKYMADATSVRLTRDPDTLAHALEKVAQSGGGGGVPTPAVEHMCIVAGDRRAGLFGGFLSMFPPLDARLRALSKLGAFLDREPVGSPRPPLRDLAIAVPLVAIAGLLLTLLVPALAYLSLVVSLYFTAMGVSLLHVFLRWIGH